MTKRERKRIQQEAERIRKESGLPALGLEKLMALPDFRRAVMDAAGIHEPDRGRGEADAD